MTARGGPPRTVSVGGREFASTGSNSPNVVRGGVENEHLVNGDGKTARKIETPIPWSVSSFSIVIDNANGDAEYLVAFQKGDDGDIVFTWSDGSVDAGVGNIEGTFADEKATASTSIEFKGPGELKRL